MAVVDLIISYCKSSSNCVSHGILFSSTWLFRNTKQQNVRVPNFQGPLSKKKMRLLWEKRRTLRSENTAGWPEGSRCGQGHGWGAVGLGFSWSMLEMQIFRPHLKPTESGTCVWSLTNCSHQPSRYFWCTMHLCHWSTQMDSNNSSFTFSLTSRGSTVWLY